MSEPIVDQEMIQSLAKQFESAKPEDILKEAVTRIPRLTVACSFGAEDMVLVDMFMKIYPEIDVFYLDTDLLFQETYELINEAVERYGLPNLHQVKADLTLKEQAQQYGEELWKKNPDLCCHIRKVRPLQKVLANFDGWVTGIRREQASTRRNAQVFEYDAKFNLIKVNPLAIWTNEQVWTYIHDHHVPYNPMHDKGYPSIGCHPCTKSVLAGEDPRSGRWAGMTKTECGLHR